jgi:hypothetical protein
MSVVLYGATCHWDSGLSDQQWSTKLKVTMH